MASADSQVLARPADGIGIGGPPPPALESRPATPDELQRHYVSGSGYVWLGQFARALTWAIDPLEAQFGDDLYERMALDPQIAACLQVLKAAIIEEGLTLAPAIQDEADPAYDAAVAIRDELAGELEDMETSLDDVLFDLLGALALGSRLAEQVYELGAPSSPDLPKRGKILRLKDLRVKPRRSTAYVVDGYLNVLGVLAQQLNQPSPVLVGWVIDPKTPPPNLVPREKVLLYTFRPHDADPRGTSLLRPAYTAWWLKQQILPEWRKYLATFAGGSIWGTTPEGAESVPNDDGTPSPTPEQLLAAQLAAFRNGSATAAPFGTAIHIEQPKGEGGDPFLGAFGICDTWMTKAILTQTLATEEGEHQARAAAEVHQDALGTLVRQAKRKLVWTLQHQVLRRWVKWNLGEGALHLTPRATLGTTERQDLAQLWTAAASLNTSQYLHASQYPAMDEKLGLPVRDLTEEADPAVTEADASGENAEAPAKPKPGENTAPEPGKPEDALTDKPKGKVTATFDDPFLPAAERAAVTAEDRKAARDLWALLTPALAGLLQADATPKARWHWDATRRRYRDGRTGSLLAPAKLQQARDRLASSRAATDRLAQQIADGTLNSAAWEAAMQDTIVHTFAAQMAAGRGGFAAMTDADWSALEGMVRDQFRFLSGFAGAVATGELSQAAVAARSALYVGASAQAFEAGRAATYRVAVPAQPGDGSAPCLGNCRCSWRFTTRADGTVEARWIAHDDGKTCTVCAQRGTDWHPLVLLSTPAPATERKAA